MSDSPSDTPSRERGPNELFCRNCGAIVDREAEICPSCGVRQRPPPKSSVDSALDDLLQGGNPFVAALLSALFPGLGQIYNRELERGLVFVVATIVGAFSTLVFVGFILLPAVWLFAIYDAYTRAELRAEQLRADAHARELPISEATDVETAAEGEPNGSETGAEDGREGEEPERIAVDEDAETDVDVDEDAETDVDVDEDAETDVDVDEDAETDEAEKSS